MASMVVVVGGDVGDLDAPRLDERNEPGAPALEDADQADRRVGQLGPVDDPPGLEGVVVEDAHDLERGDLDDEPLGPRERDVDEDLRPPGRGVEEALELDPDQGGQVLPGDDVQGRDGVVLAGELIDPQLGPELLDALGPMAVSRGSASASFSRISRLSPSSPDSARNSAYSRRTALSAVPASMAARKWRSAGGIVLVLPIEPGQLEVGRGRLGRVEQDLQELPLGRLPVAGGQGRRGRRPSIRGRGRPAGTRSAAWPSGGPGSSLRISRYSLKALSRSRRDS